MLGTDATDNLEEHPACDSGVDCVTECRGLSESTFPAGAFPESPSPGVCGGGVWV